MMLAALPARAAERPVHAYLSLALSPDGTRVASIEGDQAPSGEVVLQAIVIRPVAGGAAHGVTLPCGTVPDCTPSSLTWSADGRTLAFVLRTPNSHAHAVYTVAAAGGSPRRLLAFNGTLVDLRYGKGDSLSVLATADANKEVGATAAGAADVGVLGTDVHEQRIAVLRNGALHFVSPPDLFVYEYDALPDGGFVGTAAPGDGDNHWWIAKLYRFGSDGQSRIVYSPSSAQQQLGVPRVSPDGRSVSFIGGLMSDFGPMGGDAYVLDLATGAARDLTPGLHATVRDLSWDCSGQRLLATLLAQDKAEIATIPAAGGAPDILYATQERLGAGFGGPGTVAACSGSMTAAVHQFFSRPPEIEVGAIGAWHDLTHANAGLGFPVAARSLSWRNDGYQVQGWLLLPATAEGGRKIPLITEVHGGPAWANMPSFVGPGLNRKLLAAGYAMLLPNPRGSYGQGEAFTRGNVRDLGYGDLRDILGGIDEAERVAPIDEHRLGLTGWSYGGFMTMWAVTQTNRFAAAVAGAGVSDWESYYGENGISDWMIPYFGASVYQDPAIYARSSPIAFITHVHTPTLEVVGERDIECPAPQTQEFWHALTDLGVPTTGVIYPGEGHGMRDPAHLDDFESRTLAWFRTYFAARS
jgi:dipeptidyl aminopeptidase/acylaminoacyl peptidase